MPCLGSGQNSRSDIAHHQAEADSQNDTFDFQVCLSVEERVSLGITKEKFTDKRSKGSCIHTDVKIILIIQFLAVKVDKWRQKTRHHIQQVQSVEAVGNYKKVTG